MIVVLPGRVELGSDVVFEDESVEFEEAVAEPVEVAFPVEFTEMGPGAVVRRATKTVVVAVDPAALVVVVGGFVGPGGGEPSFMFMVSHFIEGSRVEEVTYSTEGFNNVDDRKLVINGAMLCRTLRRRRDKGRL